MSEGPRCHVQILGDTTVLCCCFSRPGKANWVWIQGPFLLTKGAWDKIKRKEFIEPSCQTWSTAHHAATTTAWTIFANSRTLTIISSEIGTCALGSDNDKKNRPGLEDVAENEETKSRRSDLEEVTNQDEIEVEDCEHELDESMQGAASHICDWTDLQKDIKDHLKKNCKTLPLSQVNQFPII